MVQLFCQSINLKSLIHDQPQLIDEVRLVTKKSMNSWSGRERIAGNILHILKLDIAASSHFPAPFHGFQHGDLVGVFDVAAYGNAHCNPCDFQPGAA
jgi:hypothetical protein